MTDDKTTEKSATDSAKAEDRTEDKATEKKSAPRRGTRTETADDRTRGSVLEGARTNWVDGKPEKIADPKTSAEAFEDADRDEDAEFAPTPWRETNPALDNRDGEQQVTKDSWAAVPQQVSGPEVGQNDPRVNTGRKR